MQKMEEYNLNTFVQSTFIKMQLVAIEPITHTHRRTFSNSPVYPHCSRSLLTTPSSPFLFSSHFFPLQTKLAVTGNSQVLNYMPIQYLTCLTPLYLPNTPLTFLNRFLPYPLFFSMVSHQPSATRVGMRPSEDAPGLSCSRLE